MATETLSTYVQRPLVAKRFVEVLGEKEAKRFCSALISIYNGSKQLQECTPYSITAAAGLAAVTGLSISPTLGQAYIVPYKKQAQFQVGWKGLVQLAHRTGKYTALNAGKVCEGEITGINPVTGEAILGEKTSDEVVGYVAYMRLTNGFEKTLYMTKAEIEKGSAEITVSVDNDIAVSNVTRLLQGKGYSVELTRTPDSQERKLTAKKTSSGEVSPQSPAMNS